MNNSIQSAEFNQSDHLELFLTYGVETLCGLNVSPNNEPNSMLGAETTSTAHLSNLTTGSIRLPIDMDQNEVERLLRRAMWAEYDAECFCKEVERLTRDIGIELSQPFQQFERFWRRDELDHALGFAKIYATLFSKPENEVVKDLLSRSGDFSKLRPMMRDELHIALLVAYDEIATTKSYMQDAVDFYPKFGFPALVPWIRRVAADEARHFRNLIEVIRTVHSHRKHEIPIILDSIVNLDKMKHEYAGTFALDHDDDQFPHEMMDLCKEKVLRALDL